MDVSQWPVGKLMQLPDWCFGTRWWVGEYMGSTGGLAYYRKGEETLPQKMVVWGVLLSCYSANCIVAIRATIRMGTSTPTSAEEMNLLDRVLKGISISTITYELFVNQNGVTWIDAGRQLVEANGRSLVLLTNGDQSNAYEMTVGLLISTLPTEIPDWLAKDG